MGWRQPGQPCWQPFCTEISHEAVPRAAPGVVACSSKILGLPDLALQGWSYSQQELERSAWLGWAYSRGEGARFSEGRGRLGEFGGPDHPQGTRARGGRALRNRNPVPGSLAGPATPTAETAPLLRPRGRLCGLVRRAWLLGCRFQAARSTKAGQADGTSLSSPALTRES